MPQSLVIYGCMTNLIMTILAVAALAISSPLKSAEAQETSIPVAGETESAAAVDPADVKRVEDYFKTLSTAKARFLQTANDGQQLLGTFYLNRPGRLRFEFDPPVKDFIVADGVFIYFYDSQLKEQSNAPIGQTLADFLLRKDLMLSGDLTVLRTERAGGLLRVTLAQTKDMGAGTLTLGFAESPLELKKWRVVDATGSVVEVELFQMERGIKIPSDTFAYHNPEAGGGKLNQ